VMVTSTMERLDGGDGDPLIWEKDNLKLYLFIHQFKHIIPNT
jgi:hypothetical protein